MQRRSPILILRGLLALAGVAGIVVLYRAWVHVNVTTVALTLLLLVLVIAAQWGLRFALVAALAAGMAYNYFFLPPIGTLRIADPQNWLALFAFLATATIASRLSDRARRQAEDARSRQRELEVLLRLSREFLRADSFDALIASVPAMACEAVAGEDAALYLLEGDRILRAGASPLVRNAAHLRQQAFSQTDVHIEGEDLQIPLRTGARPKGLLVLRGSKLSKQTAQALGGLVSVCLDRAQALEDLARNQAAKESERLRTVMIDSITHELRTPLTSIKGAASTLLGSAVDAEQQHELLSIIDEESNRLNKLLSEAVQMAQLDAKLVQMHCTTVQVADVIRHSLQACPGLEEMHPVRLQAAAGLQIRADPAVFQKALCNLLDNAGKYSAAGAPITVTGSRRDGEIAISVADEGIGIDAAEQRLIFERFYRGHSHTTAISGTGMGLAIARAIVEAHQGRIEVASQPGQGSTFTILLPIPRP